MRTDESNLRAIKNGLRKALKQSRWRTIGREDINTPEQFKDVVEEFSKSSNGFIVETIKYNPTTIVMNITSVFEDYGLYNFNITVSAKQVNMTDKEKFEELLRDFGSREIEAHTVGDWVDNIPNDLYEKHFSKFKQVGEVEVESDRWCRIITSVIEVYGFYLGITHVAEIHNNNTDISDCLKHISVAQMKKSNKSTFTTK